MRIALAAALIAAALPLVAQEGPPPPQKPIAFTPQAIVWKEGPPSLPAGATMAVLEGDPRSNGMFTMRVRIPAGAAIPPHWHPREERVTILSGAVSLGFGTTADPAATVRYGAGSFYVNPPRVMHYLFFPEATEMQMTGVGPWELHTEDLAPTTATGAAAVPTATVTVRDLKPAPGSELEASDTLTATIDYDIRNFRRSTFYLTFVFETTTPNRTFSPGPVVVGGDSAAAPPLPSFLQSATGTTTLTQPLARVLAYPELKRPIRVRVYVHQQTSDRTSHVVGMSDWFVYR